MFTWYIAKCCASCDSWTGANQPQLRQGWCKKAVLSGRTLRYDCEVCDHWTQARTRRGPIPNAHPQVDQFVIFGKEN